MAIHYYFSIIAFAITLTGWWSDAGFVAFLIKLKVASSFLVLASLSEKNSILLWQMFHEGVVVRSEKSPRCH